MKRGRSTALLWVFAVIVLFAWLGGRGLNEPDEGRYAEVGREMAATGDWLMPHLNGFEHVQKPPLLYWTTALSFRWFGVDEWAARLACVLPALGTLCLTWFLAGALFNRGLRPLAVLILLSSCEFLLLSRTLTPDMMLTFWITSAIACLVKYVKGGGNAWRIGFFAALGIGFLCKGPMALVVPISAALFWQRALSRRGSSPRLRWASGLPITVVLGGWWFVVVVVQHPPLLQYFLGYELRDRVFSDLHGRSQPFWFFVPVLLAGALPWTPALIGVLWSGGRRLWSRERLSPELWLLAGWLVPPLLVLSLTSSKLATYVLPLFPALALLAARWCQLQAGSRTGRWAIGASVAMALLIGIALPLALMTARLYFPPYAHVSFSLGFSGLLVLLIVLLAWLLTSVRRSGDVTTAALGLGLAAAVLWVGLLTQADRLLAEEGGPVRPLTDIIKATPGADAAEVFAIDVRGNGLEFYLQRLVSRTENQSDIVLPLSEEQRRRVISSINSYVSSVAAKPAIGIVNPDELKPGSPLATWRVLAVAGRHVLIANDALLQVPAPGAISSLRN
jgi:4-amino-4-deoxy-L-arabinose transferase-like glycosyltransferase